MLTGTLRYDTGEVDVTKPVTVQSSQIGLGAAVLQDCHPIASINCHKKLLVIVYTSLYL
jgi:hypothetical protein